MILKINQYIWKMKRLPFPRMCQKCEQEENNEKINAI